MSRCPALHLAQRPKKEAPLGPPAWRLRSEGDQGLQCRINRHQRLGRLLLKQHLGRQLSQPGIALSAERQIIEQLPAALLQAGFAGQRSHGRAPHRTLQPAGGGSRARPRLDAERSAANVSTGGLVKPLRRPPTMKRAGAETVQELLAASPPRCSPPWGEPTGHGFCS